MCSADKLVSWTGLALAAVLLVFIGDQVEAQFSQ